MEADKTLLHAAKKMNGEALVKIFELYAPALYNYAFRLCRDASMADHIVGDVFAKFLEHLSAGTGPSTSLRAYLYKMAYHLVVDEARYARRSAPLEVADFMHHHRYSAYANVENRVLFETVMRAIKNDLTEDQRHVVILRYLNGFSLKETATSLGKEVGNVKAIQSRAIGALRKALDDPILQKRAVSGD